MIERRHTINSTAPFKKHWLYVGRINSYKEEGNRGKRLVSPQRQSERKGTRTRVIYDHCIVVFLLSLIRPLR